MVLGMELIVTGSSNDVVAIVLDIVVTVVELIFGLILLGKIWTPLSAHTNSELKSSTTFLLQG